MMAVYSYYAYRHFKLDDVLLVRPPKKEFSTAENILYILREDGKFTKLEAKVLDVALVLHAEHGGANLKVMQMFDDLKQNCTDIHSEDAITEYLCKILDKEAFDHAGLIYVMGDAVYTDSDLREVILKEYARKLSIEKGMEDEFKLYATVESIAAQLISKRRHLFKPICANVDFYSGFVYTMLGIPMELFTLMFAISRISGWSAHRLEELVNNGKIIRPAYRFVGTHDEYVDLDER